MFGASYFGQTFPAGYPPVIEVEAPGPVAHLGDIFRASLTASQTGRAITASRTTAAMTASRNETSLTGSRYYAVITDSEVE